MVEAYARLIESEDAAVRDAAAQEWSLWEDTHISIGAGGFQRDPRWEDQRYRDAFLRLTAHYWSNDGFCGPPILECMDCLRGIPGTMIQGRRDISSPLMTAWKLYQSWAGSTLIIDEGDGHGGPSLVERWRRAN